MIRIPSLRLAATASLVALAASCTSVTFKQQDIVFDLDVESDSVTIELEYLNVGPTEDSGFSLFNTGNAGTRRMEIAHTFVKRVTEGDATFVAFMPYGDWDVEEFATDKSTPEPVREFLLGIQVLEARADLDSKGELNLYQKIHVPDLSKALGFLNEEIRRFAVEEGFADKKGGPAPAPGSIRALERRNQEILLADVASGMDWVQWTESGLEVHVPICSEYALAMIQEGLQAMAEADGSELMDSALTASQMLAAARDFRIEKDHLVLIFGDENGDLSFSFQGGFLDKQPDYRAEFVQYLKDSGMTFPAIFAVGE